MLDALVTAHSLIRWVVIVVLTGVGGYALVLANEQARFDARPFAATAGLVDLQATIGVVLYVWGAAWEQGPFLAYVHPVLMLAAVASVHIGLVRARRREGRRAFRIAGVAYLFPLLLFAFGIPWTR